MNRAGFRAIRVAPFGAGSPEGAGVPGRFALVACLLGFGLTHGSLPVPASAIGRARCFRLKA
jgi:iron complex transport system permease protein